MSLKQRICRLEESRPPERASRSTSEARAKMRDFLNRVAAHRRAGSFARSLHRTPYREEKP